LDLAEGREVSQSEAEAFAQAHNLQYMETSALNGENIAEAFLKITQDLYEKVKTGVIILESSTATKPSAEKGCCG
jgi:GTPase SAR1 family protein